MPNNRTSSNNNTMASDNKKNLVWKHQTAPQDGISCKMAEDNKHKLHEFEIQPDGLKSYAVCLAAALCNVVVMGYCYSFGVLFPPLLRHFQEDKATTAWVGSLYMSVSTFLGPMASNLCDRYGCRITTIFGGLMCVLGLLLTSQVPSIFSMYLTYSVIVGFGSCCVYTASFVVVPRFFIKRRAQAIGIVCCGPAGGSLVMGPLLQLFLDTYGWRNTFIAMSGMASAICVLALAYDPRTAAEIAVSKEAMNAKHLMIAKKPSSWCRDIFRNPALATWTLCCAVLNLGLYNPQVLLVNFAEQRGVSADKSALFFFYMGIASGVARIAIGRFCDFDCVNAQAITQAALYINSAAIFLLPRANNYYHLLAYSLLFGFCDGSYGATINFQILGCVKSHLTSKAFGFWLGVISPSIAAGPPIAGFIADRMNSYAPAFYVSASFVFAGATVPFLLCCLHGEKSSSIQEEEDLVERETAL